MTDLLQGKVAVVTGASRGMGKRIAETLVRNGARVALLARASPDLVAAAQEIGERALPVDCDVSDADAVRAAFSVISETFGRIDILINNAAITELNKVEATTDSAIQREIAINLAGPIYCCREAIPRMRAAGGGDIINISSESVRSPFPYLSIYAATKAGLETFSTGLRGELRDDAIRVTILRCGHVGESSITRNWSPDVRAAYTAEATKSGHLGSTGEPVSPNTIASAIVGLLVLPREVNVDLYEIRSNLTAGQ